MLLMLGEGGTVPIPNNVINDLANGNLTPTAGWIAADRDRRRVRTGCTGFATRIGAASGLVAPPVGLTIIKIGGVAAAAVALLFVCNTNRGALVTIRGVPWVVLIVLGVLGGVDVASRPDPVRSLHVRDRRQPRGGTPRAV